MKIKKEDYKELEERMRGVFPHRGMGAYTWLKRYRYNKIGKDHDKRCRWDCFHCTDREWRMEFTDRVYKYLDDTHIDTALRKIYKTLVKEELT